MEFQNKQQTKLEQQRSRGSRQNFLRPRALSTTSLTIENASPARPSVSKNLPQTALLRSNVTPKPTPLREPHVEGAPQVHPFANSTSRLELIPPSSSITVDGINVEEEARLYDELCRSYEDETDAVGPSL